MAALNSADLLVVRSQREEWDLKIAAQIGKARARMQQWESALVPAGEELTLRNASEEPSVVLLVLAPPPA